MTAAVLSILSERKLAVMLPQEAQETLVIAWFQVEELGDPLLIAPCLLQSAPDHLAHVGAGDLALDVHGVDGRPEGLAFLGQARVEIIGDGAAALAGGAERGIRLPV